MTLEAGTRLGHYEVVSSLGAGGMGEVYRAKDTKLGREVAIKLLLEEVSADPERLARFDREARVLASLNHKNIASLHAFEREGDTSFLVMELVEGETLADRIARGPIPVDEAIPLFLQIAEGLEAAHDRGVIHRDLKPANIKLGTDESNVKILDFGLAKALINEADTVDPGLSNSPTLTLAATQRGQILGTAAYMSPEQAQGMTVDERADIWAFGACLWEALTGKRAFGGENPSQTLASVLKDAPDWSSIVDSAPSNVVMLTRRCLEKKPRARLHSIADARIELQESLSPPQDAPPRVEPTHPGLGEGRTNLVGKRTWLLVSAVALVAIGAGYLLRGGSPTLTVPEAIHLPLALPAGVEIPYGFTGHLAISPDGQRIAYRGRDDRGQRIFLQDLSQPGSATLAEGARGHSPFFSPDGATLGYLRGSNIMIVALGGGEPSSIVSGLFTGASASWASDDWIYFVRGKGGIRRVSVDNAGEEEVVTTTTGLATHFSPQLLPGEEYVLHGVSDGVRSDIAVTSTTTGERTSLLEGAFKPLYVATGHLLVAQPDTLLGMTFDPATLRRGRPVSILKELMTDAGEGLAAYAVSAEGSLAYLTGALEREGWLVRLAPGEEPQRLNSAPFPDLDYLPIDLSPDGRKVAVADNQSDVWIFDLGRRDRVRLTSSAAFDWNPLWHPREGLAFSSTRNGWSIFYRSADGLGEARLLVADERAQKWPRSWSPDGQTLLFDQRDPDSGVTGVWSVPLDRPTDAAPFLTSPFQGWNAAFSPDGRWVAYQSNESGRPEIWVTSYPEKDVRQKISRAGGIEARWGSSSERLFYRSGDSVMAVEALDSEFRPSEPVTFVEGVSGGGPGTWDVAPDGESVIALERRPPPRLHLVQNWFEELKRLVPTD